MIETPTQTAPVKPLRYGLRACQTCGALLTTVAVCSRVNPFTADCADWMTAPYQQHEHVYCETCKTWSSDAD